ncbi:MAG: type II and III secretion system protein [Kiritimatiellaceae bacterium]|nr:type II and III secretion system protein [Kiritimatiellaceae bacterium]
MLLLKKHLIPLGLIALIAHTGYSDQPLRIEELASKRFQLSHIDPERCILILQTYGFHTAEAGTPVDPEKIPVIIPLPSTEKYDTVSKPGIDLPLTENDPINELIIFHDPANPEQVSRVISTIEQYIDIPARQIIIEALILEITEKSLNALGAEWEMLTSSDNLETLRLGKLLNPTDFSPTLELKASDIFGEFAVELQALVETGDAEILSRPSILTLNNRMAYINVSQEIPVSEGQFNRDGNLTSVRFKDKVAGIQLGVRPRISNNEKEVGMQISASVTAIVPNEEVELKNSDGDIIASSPTLSVREVQTYARIANNMPFIIGGLVARDDISVAQKVPFLGDLPLIGWLFRAEAKENSKREVVIVITPYILPEDDSVGTQVGEKSITLRTLPNDDDAFDSYGNRLFRPSYRIRSTDVFNLSFLSDNTRLKEMQLLADEAVELNVLLKEEYPWSAFADGRIPGEQILVFRQMYEVIERTKLAKEIETKRIIFFGENIPGEDLLHIQLLDHHLERIINTQWEQDTKDLENPMRPSSIWDRINEHAIAITFTTQGHHPENDILNEPVPKIQLLDCPDQATYDRLLWDLNQPMQNGQSRHSVLLSNEEDLLRLKRAILLRQTAELNATQRSLTLDNFTIGQNLLMPDITPEQTYLLDSEVARFFFYSKQYYMALQQILDHDMNALQAELNVGKSN